MKITFAASFLLSVAQSIQLGVPVAMEIEASGAASAFRSTPDLLQSDVENNLEEANAPEDGSMADSIVLVDSATRKELQDAERKENVSGAPAKAGNLAAQTGTKVNGAGDLAAFLSALVANSGMCVGCILVFIKLRDIFPLIYSNNVLCGIQPIKPAEGTLGWARAALFQAGLEENIKSIGMDNALLLEFTNLCMRIMALIAVPMVGIMGPMNYLFGGHAADTVDKHGNETHDRLSYMSFGNVQNGSWLYWLHSLMVWYVVMVVVHHLRAAQKKFLGLRFDWLETLPDRRAKTILVEGIPERYRSDDALRKYFESLFAPGDIESAYVAKDTAQLLRLIGAQAEKRGALEQASASSAAPQDQQQASALRLEVEDLGRQIEEARAAVWEQSRTVSGVNMSMGFVTFKETREAELALMTQCTANENEFVLSIPPDPEDVRWCDLVVDESAQFARDFLGMALVVGLYFAYMPLVVGISKVAQAMQLGPLQPLWEGLAPTMGLQIMVAFLPTFLLLIFQGCFVLKANAFAQLKLQNWYFWFQVVFVVLVTAIGGSVVEFTETLFQDPFATFGVLGRALPNATHFYMNFLVLQWCTHCMNLLRYVNLLKFQGFKKICNDEEEARKASEPEDQDYYGLGSRSARFTINMLIGIIFGTLSPPICVLTLINFAVCRLVYGYLIPFAETKKADLGGAFWVAQLNHVFVGLIIYCVMMTGVFTGRAATHGPDVITILALIYVIYSRNKFQSDYRWTTLPFEKVNEVKPRPTYNSRYVQLELYKDAQPDKMAY